MTLNTMPHEATYTSVLTKPVGKKLTAVQQRNRTCRKVGLPPKASPSMVKERLKRENPARDDRLASPCSGRAGLPPSLQPPAPGLPLSRPSRAGPPPARSRRSRLDSPRRSGSSRARSAGAGPAPPPPPRAPKLPPPPSRRALLAARAAAAAPGAAAPGASLGRAPLRARACPLGHLRGSQQGAPARALLPGARRPRRGRAGAGRAGRRAARSRRRAPGLGSAGLARAAGDALAAREEQRGEALAKPEKRSQQRGGCPAPRGRGGGGGRLRAGARRGRDDLDFQQVARLESTGFARGACDKQWEGKLPKPRGRRREGGGRRPGSGAPRGGPATWAAGRKAAPRARRPRLSASAQASARWARSAAPGEKRGGGGGACRARGARPGERRLPCSARLRRGPSTWRAGFSAAPWPRRAWLSPPGGPGPAPAGLARQAARGPRVARAAEKSSSLKSSQQRWRQKRLSAARGGGGPRRSRGAGRAPGRGSARARELARPRARRSFALGRRCWL